MLRHHRPLPALRAGLALCALAVLLLALPAVAAAEAPAVSVRVEGLNETKLAPTTVTLAGAPVVKDGNAEDACSITSALGALQLATGGNWAGPWSSKFHQYSIYSIDGETHEFEESSKANYFWSFWLNDKEAEVGACEAQLNPGDRVLFFPSCFGEECPTPAPLPLEVETPAVAGVGEPVQVSVKRFSAAGVGSEMPGASVVGGGAGGITDSHGRATLTFAHAGPTLIQVSAPYSIRTEAVVCVHNGNDGSCGTTVPPVPCPLAATSGGATCPVCGPPLAIACKKPPPPFLLDTAKAGRVRQGHTYRPRTAPRVLSGTVEVPEEGTLRDVRISLTRRVGKRCWVFSGVRVRFVRARCGGSHFFSVGGSESFSYLLPSRLPRGRYTYEVQALDAAGHHSELVPGVSEVSFRVA
jgi:hypothetical protein